MKRMKRLISTSMPLPWPITQITAGGQPPTDYTVYPGPEDISIFNASSGVYQKSVTLIARMYTNDYKPTTASNKSIFGLPSIIWLILIGLTLICFLILSTLFFCCWLLPKQKQKLFSSALSYSSPNSGSLHSILPQQRTTTNSSASSQIMAQYPPKYNNNNNPPKYTAPPPPPITNYYHQHQSRTYYAQSPERRNYSMNYERRNSGYQPHYVVQHQQQQQQHQQQQHHQQIGANEILPQIHKSCWALDGTSNGASTSSSNESQRTRSLPSRKNERRPASTAVDDLEELYAKVNFSKKRRNRMNNDEAAIIALCRSRSQNLASEAVVIYDERTNL